MVKKVLSLLIGVVVFSVLFASSGLAAGEKVVSLGSNLSKAQRSEMLEYFDVDEEDVKIITVTNKEEREYLAGIAPESKIGTRAISSAFVELMDEGEGITVETYNIDWVTEEMYASALTTAGVKDARVIAAAPFKVSGTAALTGITKAFEEISGKKLSKDAKEIANEELVKTGELGDEIGKDKAAALVKEIKEKVIKDGVKDPDRIYQIIIQIAGDLNINLSEKQIQELVSLMEKIAKLDISVADIQTQLKNIQGYLDKIARSQEEAKGILEQIRNFFQKIVEWIQRILR
ncbi:MAG: DUF1002 domain-containing protein [Clostridia bacterium]|jgi:uncharacterized protein YpuA (DUF1002 family)